MQNFRHTDDLDISPLCLEVARHMALFGRESWREDYPESPHSGTRSLYLRMPSEITVENVFQSLEVADRDLMLVPAFEHAVTVIGAIAHARVARAMIVELAPSGVIAPHPDQGAYAEATDRWHLPIATNACVAFVCGDEVVNMRAGELWWFDKRQVHSVENHGPTARYHLIVDTFK